MALPVDPGAFAYLGYTIRYTTAPACAREATGDRCGHHLYIARCPTSPGVVFNFSTGVPARPRQLRQHVEERAAIERASEVAAVAPGRPEYWRLTYSRFAVSLLRGEFRAAREIAEARYLANVIRQMRIASHGNTP